MSSTERRVWGGGGGMLWEDDNYILKNESPTIFCITTSVTRYLLKIGFRFSCFCVMHKEIRQA